MSAQIIEKNGKPEYAVVPIDEYNALRDKAELLEDITAYDLAIKELANAQDELIPAEVAKRLLDRKDSPLKIWREFRNLTQETLSNVSGLSQPQIASLETGARKGTIDTWKTLADCLDLDLDDLLY